MHEKKEKNAGALGSCLSRNIQLCSIFQEFSFLGKANRWFVYLILSLTEFNTKTLSQISQFGTWMQIGTFMGQFWDFGPASDQVPNSRLYHFACKNYLKVHFLTKKAAYDRLQADMKSCTLHIGFCRPAGHHSGSELQVCQPMNR